MSNIVFEENSRKFEGHTGTLSVSNPALDKVKIFPSPAASYVQLTGLNGINGVKTAILYSVNGSVIARETASLQDVIRFSTATLSSGIYLLQLQTEEGVAQYKVVK